jgi:plasmid maintenance system antidote protein VapI
MKGKSRIQPVHPGDFLREELAGRGISMNQLARDIRIPMSRVSLAGAASLRIPPCA